MAFWAFLLLALENITYKQDHWLRERFTDRAYKIFSFENMSALNLRWRKT